MVTVDFPIFVFMGFCYLMLVILPFVWRFLKRLGWSPGPATRAEENELYYHKFDVLHKHGMQPDEKNRKFKWFGLFSYIDDDVPEEGFDDEID